MPTTTHWPSLLRQLHALEQSWNTHKVRYPREDAVHYLPFPIPQFISMLADAVMAAPVRWGADSPRPVSFIDVGCGPGTKVRLAEELFGLTGFGIDIVPAFVAEALQGGIKAEVADAFSFGRYHDFDIVFANRPSTLQDDLEPLILRSLGDDAVLIAANWQHRPDAYGLSPVAVEIERPVCGVWRKPAGLVVPAEPLPARGGLL